MAAKIILFIKDIEPEEFYAQNTKSIRQIILE
jgi:hypothetical protein